MKQFLLFISGVIIGCIFTISTTYTKLKQEEKNLKEKYDTKQTEKDIEEYRWRSSLILEKR